ncbi:MAG: TetR/AcrR family transcriptional regulator [Clostridia bacterium]|nr:TetR/AcrR family transcriptional regulator [Clostridia bacterium]
MQSDQFKIDRRVVRTKHAIHNALAELMTNKDIAAITVSELAQKAAISRKTFYNYYNTIYDVLDEIESEIVDDFTRVMQQAEFQHSITDPSHIFLKLTEAVQNNLELYGHLMRFDRSGELVSKAVRAIKHEAKLLLLAHCPISDRDAELMLDYTLWGLLTVYQVWYHSDQSRTIQEVSAAIGILTWEGCRGYINSVKQ